MFEKMYADEPDNWVEVSEERVLHDLEGYYYDVSIALEDLRLGVKLRTPHAFFRYSECKDS